MRAEFYVVSFACSLLFFLWILHLVRSRRLREQYALLWLLLAAGMTALSLAPEVLDRLALLLGVAYAPSLLYFIGLLGVLALLLRQTLAVSELSHKLVRLTQSEALHQEQLRRLERRVDELEAGRGGRPDTEKKASDAESDGRTKPAPARPYALAGVERERSGAAARSSRIGISSRTAKPSLPDGRLRAPGRPAAESGMPGSMPASEALPQEVRS
ncbi:DUF2304 domain-containing protein [Paenibacillus albicereus]|uniref:DUF2304 domain-containing protein n=1 Tax=Paenibacillus albicereus TaxID=2726185 RepID=A0A6H2H2D7_9BACL|nr:DUF2304 domain-containing protein [Paenibacillus albicereus]QJC53759.1 DUF2304 domain-containing protein [Paenibacillus albicereus]